MNKKSKVYIKLQQIWENNSVLRVSRIIFILIGSIFAISLVRNILTLRASDTRIADTQKKLDAIKEDNEKLQGEVKTVENEFFQEKQGRDKLGLAKEGEIIVVLPPEEKLRQMSPLIEENEAEELPKPNWRLWLDLFVN